MGREVTTEAALSLALRDLFLHLRLSEGAALWVLVVPGIAAQERVVSWIRDAGQGEHRVATYRFGAGYSLTEAVRASAARPQDLLLALDLMRLAPRERDETIVALNRGREAVADARCTVVLLVDADAQRALIQHGGDLWTWRRGVTDLRAVPGLGDDEREEDVARRRVEFDERMLEETEHLPLAVPRRLIPLRRGREAPDVRLDDVVIRQRALRALPLPGSSVGADEAPLRELLGAGATLVVEGPWGAGKRTWLRSLARDLVKGAPFARELGLGDDVVPILIDAVTLGSVAGDLGRRQLRDLLTEYYARRGSAEVASVAVRAIEEGRALVLAHSIERATPPRRRASLARRLLDTAEAHPGVRVVLTCPPYVLDEVLADHPRASLPALSASQVEEAVSLLSSQLHASKKAVDVVPRQTLMASLAADRNALGYAAIFGVDASLRVDLTANAWLSAVLPSGAGQDERWLMIRRLKQIAWDAAPDWSRTSVTRAWGARRFAEGQERWSTDGDLNGAMLCDHRTAEFRAPLFAHFLAAQAATDPARTEAERDRVRRDPRWAPARAFATALRSPPSAPGAYDDLLALRPTRLADDRSAFASSRDDDLLASSESVWREAARRRSRITEAAIDATWASPALRAIARARLGRSRDALDALQPHLDPAEPLTARLALDTLAVRCARAIRWTVVAPMASSEHAEVRAACWRLVGRAHIKMSPRGLGAMRRAVGDPSPKVRAALALALLRWRGEGSAWRRPFATLLDGAESRVARAAAEAVCRVSVGCRRRERRTLRALSDLLAGPLRMPRWIERVGPAAADYVREALGVAQDRLAILDATAAPRAGK